MRAASGVTADPAESLLREFQDTLSARQDTLLTWRAADGSTHLAVLHDCGLALTKVSLGYKLTAIFMGGAPPGPAPESGQPPLIERGRRVLKHGSLVDLQELAVRLLRQGVRGGPSYDDGPLQWALVRTDGSLRMTVGRGRARPLLPRRPPVRLPHPPHAAGRAKRRATGRRRPAAGLRA